MHFFKIFSIALDSQHIFHPFRLEKKGDYPSLMRRIQGIGLLILTIPATFCLGTGVYLFWANRRLEKIEKRNQTDLEKRVQKAFNNNQNISSLTNLRHLFKEVIQDIQLGRTEMASEKIKLLPKQDAQIYQQLIRTAIAYDRVDTIPSILQSIDCDLDLHSIPLFKAKSSKMATEIINGFGNDKKEIFLNQPWDINGNSALHKASNINVVKVLVENGALYKKNYAGDFPLHTCQDREIAKYLVKKFPDELNRRNNKNETALFTTPISIKKILLEKGANPNAADQEKRTLLHTCEDIEVAKLLINNGADLKKQDKNGKMPLHTNPNLEVKKLLTDTIAKSSIPWIEQNITVLGNTNIEECKLFCFAELHTDWEFRDYFTQVIQKYYQEEDIILVEGHSLYKKVSYKQSTQLLQLNGDYLIYGWEPENIEEISTYFNLHANMHDQLIQFGKSIKRRLSGINPSTDKEWSELQVIFKEAAEKITELNQYYQSDHDQILNIHEILQDVYKGLRNKTFVFIELDKGLTCFIRKILKKLEKCQEKALYSNLGENALNEIYDAVPVRNESLIHSINKWLAEGKKVFVIAGAGHFINFPNKPCSDTVQECIQKRNFILSTRNCNFNENIKELNPSFSQLPTSTITGNLFNN